jgi:hypothetical protein
MRVPAWGWVFDALHNHIGRLGAGKVTSGRAADLARRHRLTNNRWTIS